MFSWFRKRRDGEFFDLMRAAAEGDRAARLRSAFSTVGVERNSQNDDDDDILIAEAACALLRAVKRSALSVADATKSQYVDGLFIIVFANHFSYVLARPFEKASLGALILFFSSNTDPAFFPYIIREYNRHSASDQKAVTIVGEMCVKWSNSPTAENVALLSKAYQVLCDHIT